MKLLSFRVVEFLLLLPFVGLLLLVLAVFVTYWLEDRPQLGVADHLHENLSVKVDGYPRSFAAYVPGDTAGRPMPLVIVLHPHKADVTDALGKGFAPMPTAVWQDVAEREKFLLFYAQGLVARDGDYGWNDCRIASPANPISNDTKFITTLIDYAAAHYNLDEDRVYVAGVSNGGFMALRVAQEAADRVAAVVAGVAQQVRNSECDAPASPVSVLFMYGTQDPLIPPDGGAMEEGRGALYSAQESIRVWARWNGIADAAPQKHDVPDRDPEDGVRLEYTALTDPDTGVSVAAYRMVGGGHAIPSIVMPQPWWLTALYGRRSHDIEAAEAMWDFFRDKRRITAE